LFHHRREKTKFALAGNEHEWKQGNYATNEITTSPAVAHWMICEPPHDSGYRAPIERDNS